MTGTERAQIRNQQLERGRLAQIEFERTEPIRARWRIWLKDVSVRNLPQLRKALGDDAEVWKAHEIRSELWGMPSKVIVFVRDRETQYLMVARGMTIPEALLDLRCQLKCDEEDAE